MAKQKGKVTFNEKYCKGCELCVSVCPVQIIAMDLSRINENGYHPQALPMWKNASHAQTARSPARIR